jgi:hypothetical protein
VDEAEPRRSLASSPWAWAVLLVVYVALGLVVKSVVLNWIIGPIFPLVFLYLLPRWAGRVDP